MNNRPILYAEDEEADVICMQRAFGLAGIPNPLLILPDGQEVIAFCSGSGRFWNRDDPQVPCLLLLDLNLPKLSGIEVLKWIRKEPSISTLPIIALSSSLQDTDVHRAYVQGANAFLAKPSSPEGFVSLAKGIKDFWINQNQTAEKSWDLFRGDEPPARS